MIHLGQAIQDLRALLHEFFFSGYGDNVDSVAGDIVLPDSTAWTQIGSINNPCILYIRNLSTTLEYMLTWDEKKDGGMRIPADSIITLDGVLGVVYAKVAATGASVTINVGVIGKKLRP